MTDSDWTENVVTETEEMRRILRDSRRIAVLGIKPATRSERAAHFVPKYLQEVGYEVIPVPTYYPEVEEILGEQVYRRVADVPGDVDMVNVFRRPNDIPPHLDDILAKGPAAVWFQIGIRNDAAAERLARAGIQVVQNRCTMADHRRFGL